MCTPVKVNMGYSYLYLFSHIRVHFQKENGDYIFPIQNYTLRIGDKYKFVARRIGNKLFNPYIQELFLSAEDATKVIDIFFTI